jgi:hypothetical protein
MYLDPKSRGMEGAEVSFVASMAVRDNGKINWEVGIDDVLTHTEFHVLCCTLFL